MTMLPSWNPVPPSFLTFCRLFPVGLGVWSGLECTGLRSGCLKWSRVHRPQFAWAFRYPCILRMSETCFLLLRSDTRKGLLRSRTDILILCSGHNYVPVRYPSILLYSYPSVYLSIYLYPPTTFTFNNLDKCIFGVKAQYKSKNYP